MLISMIEKKKYRCCFTGHRPEKLIRTEEDIRMDLEVEIRKAIADGFNVFVSGMSRGVDIWAAEIVLKIRDEGIPIRLMCASPYPGFESGWSSKWQKRYIETMRAADYAGFTSPAYSKMSYQIRNEWMVNHSSRVIAVFNGHPSGTKNTIDYANWKGIPVVMIKG